MLQIATYPGPVQSRPNTVESARRHLIPVPDDAGCKAIARRQQQLHQARSSTFRGIVYELSGGSKVRVPTERKLLEAVQ